MDNAFLSQLLSEYATPMYLFDGTVLEQRVAYLRSKLPPGVGLCYAIKANPFLAGYLAPLVERLELCSPGEYRICENQGLPKSQYVVSGVYKTPNFIQEILPYSPSIFTVESMEQFHLIHRTAQECKSPVSLLLRLTSGNQFGLEKDEITAILSQHGNDPLLHFKGIQYFSGTQKTSLKRTARELSTVDEFMQSLETLLGHPMEELEFGPGFPVSYYAEDDFQEDEYLEQFSQLLQNLTFSGTITLELGRSLAAHCGTYFTRVVDAKRNRGQNYAIVDGGMHQLVYYGQSMAMKLPPIRHITHHSPGNMEPWNVCGSLCTINDILVKQLPLPSLHIGDVLAFERAGAYCMTEGISLFLSRDLPAVLYRRPDGQVDELRPHFDTYPLNTPKLKK